MIWKMNVKERVSFLLSYNKYFPGPIEEESFSAEQRQLALSVMCTLYLLWLSPV